MDFRIQNSPNCDVYTDGWRGYTAIDRAHETITHNRSFLCYASR